MFEPSFANILLTGPCNLRCPWCIGRQNTSRQSTLGMFPLPGLEAFAAAAVRSKIRQISLTGIDTEPQLYAHQARLLDFLHKAIPGAQVSLHTNGTQILRDPALFNRYDRATVSVPSFDSATCYAMTGSPKVLDLPAIVAASCVPLKVSILLTRHNAAELPALLTRCKNLGVRRVVLRLLRGGGSPPPASARWRHVGVFGGNPVYDVDGVEVTVWDFARTRLRCLTLLPNGRLAANYLLAVASDAMRDSFA